MNTHSENVGSNLNTMLACCQDVVLLRRKGGLVARRLQVYVIVRQHVLSMRRSGSK